MASYDQYYKKFKEQYSADAQAEYEKQSEQNTAISDQYLADIGAAIDKSTQNAVGKVNTQITELPTYYQSAYDANAIQQKINERKVEERMANLGLTDSGLNRTQQTALMVSKMNTDAAITQKKNAAVSSLKQQIADLEASGELEKMEIEATEKAKLATTNKKLYADLMSNADSRAQSSAASAYEADQEYAAKVEAARIAALDTNGDGIVDDSDVAYNEGNREPTKEEYLEAYGVFINGGEQGLKDWYLEHSDLDAEALGEFVTGKENRDSGVWKIGSDGGARGLSWLNAIDDNASIKYGDVEFTMRELYDALINAGYSEDKALQKIRDIQYDFKLTDIW